MQNLIERIKIEAVYLGQGIIKVDGFINHQIDPLLTIEMGQEFARRFQDAGIQDVSKVITAEISGIAPALATGQAMGVPVVYARKHRPITMPDGFYWAEAPSRTKGNMVQLMVSPEYLHPADRVVLIDDFLATGQTIEALAKIIEQAGATLCAIGCLVEKVFEPGRAYLARFNVPVISLAKIDLQDEKIVVF